MSMFYDPAGKSFYDSAIHDEVPEGAIEITSDAHALLLAALNGRDTTVAVVAGVPTVVEAVDDMATVRSRRIAGLRATARAKIVAGFESDALGTMHSYPYKESDQRNLAMIAAARAAGALWTSSDGGWALTSHTADQVITVAATAARHVNSVQTVLVGLSAEVDASTTAAAVAAIEWPE